MALELEEPAGLIAQLGPESIKDKVVMSDKLLIGVGNELGVMEPW